MTDPYGITATDSISDTETLELSGAFAIATFTSGGRTYAAVTALWDDDGVQILDVTDPSDITAMGSIGDTRALELAGSWDVATFTSGGGTYAAVTAYFGDGVQILNMTDPYGITATDSISDTETLELSGAFAIATFTSGGRTYAAVTALWDDDGVQILDVTDPSDIHGQHRRHQSPRAGRLMGRRHVHIRRRHLRGGHRIFRRRRPDTQHDRPVWHHRDRQHQRHRNPRAVRRICHRHVHIRRPHLRGGHRISGTTTASRYLT